MNKGRRGRNRPRKVIFIKLGTCSLAFLPELFIQNYLIRCYVLWVQLPNKPKVKKIEEENILWTLFMSDLGLRMIEKEVRRGLEIKSFAKFGPFKFPCNQSQL